MMLAFGRLQAGASRSIGGRCRPGRWRGKTDTHCNYPTSGSPSCCMPVLAALRRCDSLGQPRRRGVSEGGEHAAQQGDLLALEAHAVEQAPHARQQALGVGGSWKPLAVTPRLLEVRHEAPRSRHAWQSGCVGRQARRRRRAPCKLVGQHLHRRAEVQGGEPGVGGMVGKAAQGGLRW